MELVLLCAVIALGLLQWSLHRDTAKHAKLIQTLHAEFFHVQGRYDNLERSGVSLFAKHNELRDRLDAIAPQPKKEQADVLGKDEATRNAVRNLAALHLLGGKP